MGWGKNVKYIEFWMVYRFASCNSESDTEQVPPSPKCLGFFLYVGKEPHQLQKSQKGAIETNQRFFSEL